MPHYQTVFAAAAPTAGAPANLSTAATAAPAAASASGPSRAKGVGDDQPSNLKLSFKIARSGGGGGAR